MDTIKDVLHNAAQGKDFYILLGDFLDAFYRADSETQLAKIHECPLDIDVQVTQIYSAYAASTVHKLANDYRLTVPSWVHDKRFYLRTPFFAGDVKGNLRWWFMYKSPPEFKHRNLFVCENVLKRV